MPHDRDTAYRLYSVDGDSVPTLARRIGQTVPGNPFKHLPKLLTPEAEKWRSCQILLRPSQVAMSATTAVYDGLEILRALAPNTGLRLSDKLEENVAVHFSKM